MEEIVLRESCLRVHPDAVKAMTYHDATYEKGKARGTYEAVLRLRGLDPDKHTLTFFESQVVQLVRTK